MTSTTELFKTVGPGQRATEGPGEHNGERRAERALPCFARVLRAGSPPPPPSLSFSFFVARKSKCAVAPFIPPSLYPVRFFLLPFSHSVSSSRFLSPLLPFAPDSFPSPPSRPICSTLFFLYARAHPACTLTQKHRKLFHTGRQPRALKLMHCSSARRICIGAELKLQS